LFANFLSAKFHAYKFSFQRMKKLEEFLNFLINSDGTFAWFGFWFWVLKTLEMLKTAQTRTMGPRNSGKTTYVKKRNTEKKKRVKQKRRESSDSAISIK